MVSQAQRLREQQRELRGEDLRGLTKVEQLKLQQEALKKGIPRRRLLKIREQQARLRKAEASPEVKKIKRLVTNQKNIIENFKNQIKQSEKDIARLEKEIAEGDFSVDNRRIRNNSMQIERARIRAIKRVLPNLEKSLIELEKIKKQSVNAVFVGREDLAITLSKEATKFARDISGNAREIVDVAVRNEERRLAFQRRRQRRRERRREAIRELKELGFTSTEIKQLRKTGAFKITETQAEKLSRVSRRALGVDLKSFKGVSPTTYAGMTLITGEQVLVTPKGVPVATAFIPEKIKNQNQYLQIFVLSVF